MYSSPLLSFLTRVSHRANIAHRSPGSAPLPAHSLRDTRSELVHVYRLLLKSGNSENTEFLWSQLLRDQRSNFLIRAEAAGLYATAPTAFVKGIVNVSLAFTLTASSLAGYTGRVRRSEGAGARSSVKQA
ncbi:unnamed protein product [Pleuronectes platessa]|uniref:Uncharacterized protein n=1 Tax=Pleuronectes platessa TaxID=8262 RepID=A0A9N7Z370_PLEPL|nr:unnamed protein product [Pleuronectes platessa]